jgi:hypothetical protein
VQTRPLLSFKWRRINPLGLHMVLSLAVSSHPDLVECDSDALHFTFDRPPQPDRQCLRPKKSALYRQPTPSSRIPCTAHNSGDFLEHALFLGLHIDRGDRERGVSTTTISRWLIASTATTCRSCACYICANDHPSLKNDRPESVTFHLRAEHEGAWGHGVTGISEK